MTPSPFFLTRSAKCFCLQAAIHWKKGKFSGAGGWRCLSALGKPPFLYAVPLSLQNNSLPRKEKVTVWRHGLPIALLHGVECGMLSLCICPSKEHVAQVGVKDSSSTVLLLGDRNMAVP